MSSQHIVGSFQLLLRITKPHKMKQNIFPFSSLLLVQIRSNDMRAKFKMKTFLLNFSSFFSH